MAGIQRKYIVISDYICIGIVGKHCRENRAYMPVWPYQEILGAFGGQRYLFETRSGQPYHGVNITRMIKLKTKAYGYNLSAHEIGKHSRAMYLKHPVYNRFLQIPVIYLISRVLTAAPPRPGDALLAEIENTLLINLIIDPVYDILHFMTKGIEPPVKVYSGSPLHTVWFTLRCYIDTKKYQVVPNPGFILKK